jgi:phospho-N-acetylmuramoyl-pentapeptide-transferase
LLYHLLYSLRDSYFGFNVFRYITFRAAGAIITAFLIGIVLGPYIIRLLKLFNIGERIRPEEEVPGIYSAHKGKQGTPTMGGVIMIFSIIFSTLLWARLDNRYILLTIFSTLWLGALGFIDDYVKLTAEKGAGLSKRIKFLGQIMLGFVVGAFLFLDTNIDTSIYFPFFKNLVFNAGIFYILFVMIVIAGTSNAVNLTDGLDGLAIGCMVMVGFAYSVITYVSGNAMMADYLYIKYIPGAGELSIYCAALAGAGLGFLWFNSYPANVFMGDTGSLALGGGIGVVACCIKKEMLLLIVGGIFVFEAISVILQVASFKIRRRRIFLCAPFHHHLQMRGWHEPKIVVRFWIIAAILALFTLMTLKLR